MRRDGLGELVVLLELWMGRGLRLGCVGAVVGVVLVDGLVLLALKHALFHVV